MPSRPDQGSSRTRPEQKGRPAGRPARPSSSQGGGFADKNTVRKANRQAKQDKRAAATRRAQAKGRPAPGSEARRNIHRQAGGDRDLARELLRKFAQQAGGTGGAIRPQAAPDEVPKSFDSLAAAAGQPAPAAPTATGQTIINPDGTISFAAVPPAQQGVAPGQSGAGVPVGLPPIAVNPAQGTSITNSLPPQVAPGPIPAQPGQVAPTQVAPAQPAGFADPAQMQLEAERKKKEAEAAALAAQQAQPSATLPPAPQYAPQPGAQQFAAPAPTAQQPPPARS